MNKTVISLAALCLSFAAQPATATVNSFTALPSYFNWSAFGGALAIASIHGVNFYNPPGGAGAIQTLSMPVYAAALGPADRDATMTCTGGVKCEQIGALQFQYGLWKGTGGRGFVINRVGAAIFGGFQLTDPTDASSTFSFMQIYKDASTTTGIVDGGFYNGKTNGQIPYYQSNPSAVGTGWNYTGNSPQYQFFDVPFDYAPGSPPENVTFETALSNVNATSGAVTLLADFTWSFDTATGQLTGQPITFQSAPSASLLADYAAQFPAIRYVGDVLSPIAPTVPEPSTWTLALVGFGVIGGALRRTRRAVASIA